MTDLGGLRTFGPVDSEAATRFRSMLVDPSRRTQLKEASENGIDGGFAWLKATGYTSMRIVSSTDYPELVGVYLSELAEEGQDPFDAVMDLIAGASAPVNITLGDFLGLMDRGRIEEGYAADLSIFNAETIIDRSDWDYPQRFAEGIVHVLVNGSPVLRDGILTGQTPGTFLSLTRSP